MYIVIANEFFDEYSCLSDVVGMVDILKENLGW